MRYFVGFLVTIGLIVLAFVLIFNLTGRDSNSDVTAPAQQTQLTSYADTTKSARITVDGIINADSIHRQVQINISQNQSTFNLIGGYNGNVINSQTYENNQQSYRSFLFALQQAGFSRGDFDPAKADERGACPTGRRISLDVYDGNQRVQHLWTTTCGGGTFEGNLNVITRLFQRQIPDFNELTRGVDY